MYLPAHFQETDSDAIAGLVADFPLAVIICVHDGDMVANHIPLMLNGKSELVGHIAKANALHKMIDDGTRMLAIFHAEDAYISPNWYPTKKETHRHVPTWNYQVVHIRGRISFSHSRKDKFAAVGRLTKLQEQKTFGDREWKMSDAPRDYMEQMLDSIVAFRIDIESVSAKSKLSQNRDANDRDSVINMMKQRHNSFLFEAMKRTGKTG